MDERMQDVKMFSDRLFEMVDGKIRALNQVAANLESRIEDVRMLLDRITKERDKAIRIYSPSYYPLDNRLIIEFEPVDYEPMPQLGRQDIRRAGLYGLKQHSHDLMDASSSSSVQEQYSKQYGQTTNIFKHLQAAKPSETNSLRSIGNVSSLLVFHTYESRLIQSTRQGLRYPQSRSIQSESSVLQDAHNRSSFRFKSSKLDKSFNTNTNKSASNDDLESSLGPAPESIMRFQQESLLDLEMTDNMEALLESQLEEDEADLLSETLPDILPSLSNVVKDVSLDAEQLRRYESHSKRNLTATHIGTTKPLEKPIQPAATMTTASPPPPPPMPSTPLHNTQPIKCEQKPVAAVRRSTLVPEPLVGPVPPPLPPPPPPPMSTTTERNVAVTETSGRSALLAEIRSAASKPKRRTNVRTKSPEGPREQSGQSEPARDNQKEPTAKKTQGASLNPRDSLLASIREAAGKPKSKPGGNSVRSRRLDEKREQKRLETEAASKAIRSDGPVDLMSDLVSKLRARRDGISGSMVGQKEVTIARNEDSLSSKANSGSMQDSVLSKVSNMIPTRAKESSPESDRGSEDFNEDDWS